MQRPFLPVALLATTLLTGCPSKPATPEPTTSTISTPVTYTTEPPAPSSDGTWTATSAIMAGTPFPPEVTNSISLTVKGETYEVNAGGEIDKGTCKVDTSTTPPRMTITSTEGPNVGKTMLAIFDYPADDQMRVCYNLKGTDFPTTFESTLENANFLATYKKTTPPTH